ncbi:hypothetical protein GDO86_003876 [Hymenochirus boettgeri]|uniref:TIR domain-containing protein n=1 Tax=Hymenochirus boettgeri TaxID=247094 RepID=A0A8T2K5R6_9PIPI|nr:hypothetical protein GDO86_003876 [Hymenochirus boettgeri]
MELECQPLEIQNNKYLALENTLTITDPDKEDEGNYTCVVHFNYNDVTFSLTRAVDMTLRVLPELRQPLIRNPKNDIVKVELGSPVTLRCEVLNRVDIGMIWYINDTFVDSYYNFDPRIILEDVNTTVSANGEPMLVSNLHFLEVKEEDYNKKFFCVLFVPANPMAYVILQPPDPNLQPFLIAFFVSLVFLAITIVIAMKIFKVDIVLWYRSSCFASKIVKDGKLYDAYVMYPKNVSGPVSQFIEMFVLMVLPEVLERKCAYRLFIFGRDELPGEGISDVINEAISQSRRLIIILGATLPEYHLKDDFEQQIAMYDALIRNKMKVILVELEKISYYKNMPESIRYIKQKQGAVRWKGEFTDKNLSKKTKFWKHLRYYMPQEQHKDLEDMYSNSDNKC